MDPDTPEDKNKEFLNISLGAYEMDFKHGYMHYPEVLRFLSNPDWEIFGGAVISRLEKENLIGAMRNFISEVDLEYSKNSL